MPAKHTTKDGVKATHLRVWKALLMLLIAMTSGAMVLMAFGNNPPSAGVFSLSSYYKLASAEQAILSSVLPADGRWKRIEVCYSGTCSSDLEALALLQDQCHFVICNGSGGEDGQILTTDTWDTQRSVRPSPNGPLEDEKIRICMVSDGQSTYPTDCQIARVRALVDTLCKRFWIGTESVYYPSDMIPTQPR